MVDTVTILTSATFSTYFYTPVDVPHRKHLSAPPSCAPATTIQACMQLRASCLMPVTKYMMFVYHTEQIYAGGRLGLLGYCAQL